MRKKTIILIFLILLLHITSFAQCIDKEKVVSGGEYNFSEFIHRCPTYSFAYNGDKSKNWNVLNDPIDISQAPENVLLYKNKIENKIIEYSGKDFFDKIKFNSVEVVYKDKLNLFKKSGRLDVTLKYCKAKYFYYYELKIDILSGYYIGIALDKKGNILNDFNFPPKEKYIPIDTNFSYCKLIEIARKSQPEIDPIESISLEFDETDNRFFWRITQEMLNKKQGINKYNIVDIDAADLTKFRNEIGTADVIY
ncbi:hypothetical protein [Halpernia sp. GG3]